MYCMCMECMYMLCVWFAWSSWAGRHAVAASLRPKVACVSVDGGDGGGKGS